LFINWRWKLAQKLEIRWWQHYLKDKTPAQYLQQKRLYWDRVLGQLDLSFTAQDQILDAGCGPAGIFIALPQYQVDAVDPLLRKYQDALGHFNPDNYPNVSFHNAKLEDYQTEKKYNKIFCLNAINHVQDLEQCLDNLTDLLAKEGQLILSVDAHNFKFFKYLFRLIPGDALHPHQYDILEYKKMLIDRGYQIEHTINLKQQFFFDYYVLIVQKRKS
jgi:2-polyprenyl-6-hydroxyphenyl methylase/3-demethylubiquinone-9 3-methyltransferase